MLGTMVARERRSATMAHKLAYERRSRTQIAIWRAIRRGRDPETVARWIEAVLPASRSARELLDVIRPDVLLWPSTFSSPNEELEIVKACRIAGVPILALPASWDTLTGKASPLVVPDRLLVWGTVSGEHAASQGYPTVDVTGPPHWDCYADPVMTPREPVVMIAGTSLHFWQDEFAMVQALHIEALAGAWIVVYRPHPSRLRDLAFLPPAGVTLDTRLGYDLQPGFQAHLRDRLASASCVVAAFSTLIIEAALMGVPSVVPAFAKSAKGPFGILDHGSYDHMAEVVVWPGILLCRTMRGLIEVVHHAVVGELAYDPAELRRHARRIAHVGGAQERIIHAIGEAVQ